MVGLIHVLKIVKLLVPFLWSMIRSQGVVRVLRENWFTLCSLVIAVVLSMTCIFLAKEGLHACPQPMVRCAQLAPDEIDNLNTLLNGG